MRTRYQAVKIPHFNSDGKRTLGKVLGTFESIPEAEDCALKAKNTRIGQTPTVFLTLPEYERGNSQNAEEEGVTYYAVREVDIDDKVAMGMLAEHPVLHIG